jgi:hypothetical protein
MNASEIILLMDLISTMGLELWAELSKEGKEMTPEEFAKVSEELKTRRKAAIAKIKAH